MHDLIPSFVSVVCETWLGISLDEASRMRDSRERWKAHRYPLIEKRMRRADCLEWLAANNYPIPPKSACLGCPFHADAQWRELQQHADEWQEIVAYDEEIRRGVKGGACEAFLHRSLMPIDEVDFARRKKAGSEISSSTNAKDSAELKIRLLARKVKKRRAVGMG